MDLEFLQGSGILGIVGLASGLGLFWRGLGAFRDAYRIGDTAGSRVASVAVGEMRLTGVVEPLELVLTSPLQSRPCVWYRSTVRARQDRQDRVVFNEERSVGFRLRDETGAIRIFPRGAKWAVADQFKESTGLAGDEPPGLRLRTGAATSSAAPDREEQIRQLLTVQRGSLQGSLGVRPDGERRQYREARIEAGDVITIVGFVEPFNQLPDPAAADGEAAPGPLGRIDDPVIAEELAAARAAGILAPDAASAWGNAGIPGFGIGTPVRQPELDQNAGDLPSAPAELVSRVKDAFEIGPDDLVVANRTDVPLLIALGDPRAAAAQQQTSFRLGLLGAGLAIGSALALAVSLTGGTFGMTSVGG